MASSPLVLRIFSPRPSPPGSPHQPRSARSSSVTTAAEVHENQVKLLYGFFVVTPQKTEANQLKGHLAVLMEERLYQNQVMQFFKRTIENDEVGLLRKYKKLELARDEYNRTLQIVTDKKKKRPTAEDLAGVQAKSELYHHRKRKFKEFYKTTFRETIQKKYDIVLPQKIHVPDGWELDKGSFRLPDDVRIENVLIRTIQKEFNLEDAEKVRRDLFGQNDYTYLKYVAGGDNLDVGGSRSYFSAFNKRIEEIFQKHLLALLSKAKNVENLKTYEEISLCLAYKLGTCNTLLNTFRAKAHGIENLYNGLNSSRKEGITTPRKADLLPLDTLDCQKYLQETPLPLPEDTTISLSEGALFECSTLAFCYKNAAENLVREFNEVGTLLYLQNPAGGGSYIKRQEALFTQIRAYYAAQLQYMKKYLPFIEGG